MNSIIITEEENNKIQRLDMEQASRKNLIYFLLDQGIMEDKIVQFKNEYIDFFMQFEKEKNNLQYKYLDSQNIKYNKWNLYYTTRELVFD